MPTIPSPRSEVVRRSSAELEELLGWIEDSPRDQGVLELVVARPAKGERRVLDEGRLDLTEGLLGDRWIREPWKRLPDGSPDPAMQVNVMNARVASAVAVDPDRRALAGDQLYLDLDLSVRALPVGSHLRVGTAVLEVTPPAHTGCRTFVEHFGADAMRFVNGRVGRALRLRGLNARVVVPGVVRPGDTVTVG